MALIVLIESSRPKWILKKLSDNKSYFNTFPFQLASVAALLKENKHDIFILDADNINLTDDEILIKVLSINPDFVGLHAKSYQFNNTLKICRLIKLNNPNINTMVFGQHVSALPLKYKYIDKIITGYDFEVEFLNYINGNTKIKVPYQKLPYPLREGYDQNVYKIAFKKVNSKLKTYTTTTVKFLRSCPQKCIFCENTVLKSRFNIRSVENIISELKYCSKIGIEHVSFAFSSTNFSNKWLIEICKAIIKNEIKISLSGGFNINNITEESLKWFKLAGGEIIGCGIESGNDLILKKIGKKQNLYQIRKANEIIIKTGLLTVYSYMIGNIFETEKTVEETINLSIELDATHSQFTIAIPFPGTVFYNICEKNGWLISKNWDRYYFYYTYPHNLPQLKGEKMVELQKFAYEIHKKKGNQI
jgi:radical SAM superfamily enzyme YgiQ (UPF0313 family)